MRRAFSQKRYGVVVSLMAMLILGGCAHLGALGAAYEDDECRVTDLAIDRSGGYAEVTAVFENKTSSDEKFLATVALIDDSGAQIGNAMVISENAEAGQAVPSSTGLIGIDDRFVDADDAVLERVAELKVESVASKTVIGEHLSSTGENSPDPIVGYWTCLQTNLAGETHYLGGRGGVYAHFKDDGTWTLTVGDETYDNTWITSDQIDGIPYGLSFAGDTWGGVISKDGASDLLAIGSLTDTDNTMIFQRAE